MNVEAIGSNLTINQTSGLDNTSLSQEDFIRLFMAQLNFQDPLEPVDNAEFLAQMAQFTSVEQTRIMNEKMDNLLILGTTEQATGLLGKTVEIQSFGNNQPGVVKAVEYTNNGPSLTIDTGSSEYVKGVSISNVRVITTK
ncbi:flagellar hook assembly protein FlgD [Photobacterium kasasachensis]|uniref:flagellar hook assembly protein FlgD n=1 Tax=Photobacterium kasasachensis TaxID=2910240 RepID=UPI003D0F9E9B